MIPAIVETSEASIDEIKFHNKFFNVTEFSKEWKIWPKTHFLVFALFVGNFSNKHHYNLLKILRIYFVSGTFVQNDYSRSYSCLKLTYALKFTH